MQIVYFLKKKKKKRQIYQQFDFCQITKITQGVAKVTVFYFIFIVVLDKTIWAISKHFQCFICFDSEECLLFIRTDTQIGVHIIDNVDSEYRACK